MDSILNFLKSLSYIDYIMVLLLLATIPAFFFVGIRKLYKFIFGTAIGFAFFSGMNLTIASLSNSDLGSLNSLVSFFIENKMDLMKFSFYMIPVFSFLVFLNRNIEFTGDDGDSIYSKIKLWFFAPFSLIFLMGVIFSIYQNKFIFGINDAFIQYLHSDIPLVNLMTTLQTQSKICSYVMDISHVITLLGFLIIFYILTVGGLIRLLVSYVSIQIVIKKNEELAMKEDIFHDSPTEDEIPDIDLSAMKVD